MAEGEVGTSGAVTLSLNPPKLEQVGSEYKGCYVRAELDDEGAFVVRVFGIGTYASPKGEVREATIHEDLADPGLEPIKAVLNQVLVAYADVIKSKTLDAASDARLAALKVEGGG